MGSKLTVDKLFSLEGALASTREGKENGGETYGRGSKGWGATEEGEDDGSDNEGTHVERVHKNCCWMKRGEGIE